MGNPLQITFGIEGTDQSALVQFLGKAAGDALKFLLCSLTWINFERALGSAERHVHK